MSLTPRQIASRANAQKSTGPKTAEGKARSSMNAVKHGLTSQQAVLPNEDPLAYESAKQGWIDSLEPGDTVELALVSRASLADWRLQRCARAERARLAMRVRHAAELYDQEAFERAEELGLRLVHDPLNRCHVPNSDPETLQKLKVWRETNPAVIVREMQTFKEGVDWMIARWLRLGGILEREGFWHYPEKYDAIHLLGLRPDDALNEEIVGKIFLACRVVHPEPWEITADFQQAALGCEGRPIYAHRTEWLEELTPNTNKDALEILWSILQEEVHRLRELKASKLDALAELDRRVAEERAMFDDTKEGILALRYESALGRELHRSLTDLLKKRKEEGQAAKRLVNEPEVVEEEKVVKFAKTRRTAPPNEPNARDEARSPRASRGRKSEVRGEQASRIEAT